jgi:hypothetical protein
MPAPRSRLVPAGLLLAACFIAIGSQAAAPKVPAVVAGLLPSTAQLNSGDWGVFETEFGHTFSGGMHALFPQLPGTCDVTVGPELRLTIKGDTAWEQPPMLDMAIGIQADDIARMRTTLPVSVQNMLKTNPAAGPAGLLQSEKLPNGELLYIEFREQCTRHGGPTTVLRGYSRKGATLLELQLLVTRPAAEARAMASDLFARFQKLDTAALPRAK